MKFSIIFSNKDRLPLFKRALWAIAKRPPSGTFEVVVCDDGSTQDILGLLKSFSSAFRWKFIKFDYAKFEQATGLKKFWNNPCVTNNIAFAHSEGHFIYQQGSEVIAWDNCYDKLFEDRAAEGKHWLVMSSTYDVPQHYLDKLDEVGSNISPDMVEACHAWPLQSIDYRSDVTNYISLAPGQLWEKIKGYDERYFGGIACEDSDFVRRARALPKFKQVISWGVSLHQYHAGKTKYYDPPPSSISRERYREGQLINRAIYDGWDGTYENPQKWGMGQLGVVDVITN